MKYRPVILVGIISVLMLGISLWCWTKDADAYSYSERRVLAAFPRLSWENVISGDFMEDFESYTTDQFPAREKFRAVKAATELGIFAKKDNNDLYMADGHIVKQEYPLHEEQLQYASRHFRKLYDTYMVDTEVKLYFSIVPDKNYFLAEENGQLALDYETLVSYMRNETDYMTYIDITELLSSEDYYKTDTHWRQEQLLEVADRLADKMGVTVSQNYTLNTLEQPFYGVYLGQLALPVEPDTIQYLTSETLNDCEVTSYSTGTAREGRLYDMEKATGKDAYEMFLSGSEAILVIENPSADTEKELIVFRDSFGSSLVPLLVEGYKKITLVDTRYVQSEMIGEWIGFENQDVLFLYSTLLLNNSLALK